VTTKEREIRTGMLFKKKKPKGPKFSPSSSSMAPPSLSTLLPHTRHSFLPLTNPNITHRYMLSLQPTHSLSFAARFSSDKQNDSITENRITYPPAQPPAPPQPEKKSFAVATGELFLGIASRVLRSTNKINYNGNVDHEERIGAVMKDEVEPEVIWEQRVKDIEAEKDRPVVTSPGFSFSAAGLLFPYHLGVAHLLIEKGYIKVGPFLSFLFNSGSFLFNQVLCASYFEFSHLVLIIVHFRLVFFFFSSLELEMFVTLTGF
jgi:hypothetical protein